ncbi:hypothetical protein QR680_014512 [Steinernema hermaphroditum]|uniref:Peptidase S1 domain-containing protein n=1 Tax=Steinernema hermaphroditum TaxID=289476 RepID=A0AA39M4B3_9BILA|nr:hypothetical protein QR680_014512 [Steinernema hermaphroditum]
MCTLPVLFLLASAAYVAPVQFGDGLDAAEFIFGGKPVNAGEIPMLAAILFKDIDGKPDSCGGSLISKTHVLSAAHCALEMKSNITVIVGVVNIHNLIGA